MRERTLKPFGGHGLWGALAVALGVALAAGEAPVDRRQREQELIQVLTGGADWAAKDKACRELQVLGGPACIPALAGLLTDPGLSHMARCALEPMPYPEAGEALRAALDRAEGPERIGLINSLGFRREKGAVPALAALARDKDPAVAAAAAAALGRCGDATAEPVLAELRASSVPALRLTAAEASLLLAEQLMVRGDADAAARIYAELQAGDWPEHVRLGAFVGALAARPREAVPAVLRALSSTDAALRGTAIARVPSLSGEDVNSALAQALPALPPETQELLIGALVERGPALREAILEAGKAATAPGVRAAAAKALGRIGDASCVPWLAETAGGGDAAAEAALHSLALITGEDASAALREAAASAPAAARPLLIDVLARRQDAGAATLLLAESRSEDPAVRRAAFRALGSLALPEHLPALVESLLATPDDASRTEAERALSAAARRAPAGPGRTAALLAALGAGPETALRCSLLQVLGAVGGPEALTAVAGRLAAAQDEEERTAAVKALASWPDTGAVEPLLAALESGLGDAQRPLAVRGLARLLGGAAGAAMPPEPRVRAFRRAGAAAPDAASRRLLLGALPGVNHPEALGLAVDWLDDPGVKAEAALAVVTLSEAVLGLDREAAVAAARRVAEGGVDAAFGERARHVLARAEKLEDYVVGWLFSGPYDAPGKSAAELFDTVFPPEDGDGAAAEWRPLRAAGRPDEPWMLVLTEAMGGDQRAGYLRTWVYSPKAMPVRLEAGVDDALKVWVNGALVHGHNTSGPAVPGEEQAAAAFGEGWNLVQVKVLQHTGPCEFCLRFRTPDGASIAGLRATPLRPVSQAARSLCFVAHRIGTVRSEACAVADMNGDGRLDVVAGPCWYEAPDWTPHAFRTLEGQVGEDGKGYYDDFMNAPLDVDGDGRLDVVTCCWFAKALRWYRQTDTPDGLWPMIVADENGNFETGMLADVGGDGRPLEIVPAVAQTCWYEVAAGGPEAGRRVVRHDVDSRSRPFGVGVGDINGDGRPDLLRPDAWFEAPADPRQGVWVEHPWALGAKDGGIDHTAEILVIDADRDGLADVIASNAHKYGIFWYRQVREGDRTHWEQHTIDDTWSQPHSLALADLDGDGDLDLVAGKRFMAHNGGDPDEDAPLGVYWYELEPGAPPRWTRHAISYGEGIGSGLNICVEDLDGDQDLDIVVTGKWGGPVWFENRRR